MSKYCTECGRALVHRPASDGEGGRYMAYACPRWFSWLSIFNNHHDWYGGPAIYRSKRFDDMTGKPL